MLKFLNLNPDIFGIDINDLSLRLVKLRKKVAGFSLVSFNEVKIPPGVVLDGVIQDQEALAKIINSACLNVRGKKLDTKYVIVSLPEEKSFSQVIQMPVMTKKELVSAVPYEIENYIPLAIDKVYLDFQVIDNHKKDTGHLDLLVNVMPKNIVDSYVTVFRKAGLIPCILEVESQAIVRSLTKSKESTSSTLFIDFGETKSSFIISSGDSIHFTSSMPISSQQLTKAIADYFEIDFDEAEKLKIQYGLAQAMEEEYDVKKAMDPVLHNLILQIKKYMSFYQGHVSHEYFPSNGNIEKIILCGGGANLKGLIEFIFEELKIPVEIGNPFLNIAVSKKVGRNDITPQKMLSFTTALGLALRGADTENSDNIV